ncbi:hypothetical protein L226DRAFT_526689, partial [Lentinus tigrinus ALCF2SS1-7]|uniref:uncharacterized protein n=1 Tax=Lentinus tigrinus ALCF2SS1-7 TaxID=1328758 RepID=UPI0011662E4B
MAQPARKIDAMPLSNERGTPQWSSTSREGVERYFRDLERVMAKHQVADEAEKKEAALTYVPIDVAKRWESLPEYSAADYDGFKTTILGFYLGADAKHKFTVREFDEIVSRRVRTGISSLSEYMEFYGEFYPVARYLMGKTPPELTQRQVVDTLLRLLHDSRRPAVEARLNQKVPDKHRDDSYTVEQVHEAISYVIDNQNGFASAAQSREAPRPPSPQVPRRDLPPHMPAAIENAPRLAAGGDELVIKAEVLQNLLTAAIRSAREGDAFGGGASRGAPPANYNRFPDGPPRYQPAARPTGGQGNQAPPRPACYYCGNEGCSIAICPEVESDARAGLVMRVTPNGHVMLANGREIPFRRGAGGTIRDAMRAYYDRNPAHQPQPGGVANNMFALHTHMVGGAAYERTIEEEIEAHEQQAALLQEVKRRRDQSKRVQFDGVEISTRPPRTRAQKAKTAEKELPMPTSQPRAPTPLPQPSQSTVEEPLSEPLRSAGDAPVHPYAQVPDATKAGAPPSRDFAYSASRVMESAQTPRVQADIGASRTANLTRPREPAYRNQPAALDLAAEDRVFQRNFVESPSIALTPIELLSISPAMCKRLHRATGTRRVAFEGAPVAPVAVNSATIEEVSSDEDEEAGETPRSLEAYAEAPAASYQLREYTSYAAADGGEEVIVAAPTQKLRSIAAWVNDHALVECILDPGSQIVAISAAKCHDLGIAYDHKSTIPMQSANGAVHETKGLARDVPVELRG